MKLSFAQNPETFDIISTTGKIIDKRSGKALQIGDKVSFQTELEFGSLHDRAILLNSTKQKYHLELPLSSFVNSQLTVTSNQALKPVKGRPALLTGIRGNTVMVNDGLCPQTLKEYFHIDTFTIVGTNFKLPVKTQDTKKYDLVLRYKNGNNYEEFTSTDFRISKNDLKIQGERITECHILLREGDITIPITTLTLFFVDEKQLFQEFEAILNAIGQKKVVNNEIREFLSDYCSDVYGMIDVRVLFTAINDFLEL